MENFLVEYTLQTLAKLSRVEHCETEQRTKLLFLNNYPSIFNIVNYSPVLGCLAKINSYIITLTWAYRDLFFINIAFALKFLFIEFNTELKGLRDEADRNYWWTVRTMYQKLTTLINFVDHSIGGITFLAFGINTFFICLHLFNGLL